jgi:glycosyltransferase involved in cell wall biosynthesis
MPLTEDEKNKAVLFLSPFPPPFGGIASWTKILCEKGLPAPYLAFVVDTRQLSSDDSLLLLKLMNNLRREVVVILKLIYNLLYRRPKIVHLNSSLSPKGVHRDVLCIVIARIFCLPVVSHYHGNIGDFNIQGKHKFSDFSLRCLLNLSCVNIFTNVPSLNSAVTKFGLQEWSKINCVIPNYVSEKVWNHKREAVEKKNLTCVFTGNLTKAKGVDLILDIARALPNVQFDLIGRLGRDVEDLVSFDKTANVRICGIMEQAEIYKYLELTDIFLFPSLTEGFPLSVLEAMSIGLPIVCTSVGSLPEMIDEGLGGYIVGIGDCDGFIKSINKLLNCDLRKRMGSYNRTKAMREYRFDVVIKKLVDCYSKIS